MKYECIDCGSKCELITENKPEVCIKQRSRVFWKKTEDHTQEMYEMLNRLSLDAKELLTKKSYEEIMNLLKKVRGE